MDIGFPVHDEEPWFVLVEGDLDATAHYVHERCPSRGLRPGTGAEWIYGLVATIGTPQRRCHFEPSLKLLPEASSKTMPYTGDSAGAACALAMLPESKAAPPDELCRPHVVLHSTSRDGETKSKCLERSCLGFLCLFRTILLRPTLPQRTISGLVVVRRRRRTF